MYKRGDVVMRETGPWHASVHSFLRHLEAEGFTAAPKVVGSGYADDGRETLSFIEGEVINPRPWSLEGVAKLGEMLRDLYRASASFKPEPNAVWPPFFGRELGSSTRIISHCDFAPWNIVSQNDLPVGLIDWEYAGSVDTLVELAQAVSLNVRLFSDDIAEHEGLAPLADRAQQARVMLDAYGLTKSQRQGFFDLMVEYVVHDTAFQTDAAEVTRESTDQEGLWGLAWRARSASWLLRNRKVLERDIIG